MIKQLNNKLIIKLLIIGDSAVGKTNILTKFCENKYNTNFVSTVGNYILLKKIKQSGIDFRYKDVEIDGKQMYLQVWDTAGQERFKTITQTYYRGAMGIILAYAVNNLESFQNIQNWMNQIKQNAHESVIIILIGNKSDLLERQVSYDQGKQLADTYGIGFFETSAKEGTNISQSFMHIAKKIKDLMQLEEQVQAVQIQNNTQQQKKCSC